MLFCVISLKQVDIESLKKLIPHKSKQNFNLTASLDMRLLNKQWIFFQSSFMFMYFIIFKKHGLRIITIFFKFD